MKKLITLALLLTAVVQWCWADTKTDVIPSAYIAKNTLVRAYDSTNVETIVSGTEYLRTGNIDGYGTSNPPYWNFKADVTGVIANTTPVGNIRTITFYAYRSMSFYTPKVQIRCSDTPITQSNYTNATQIGEDLSITNNSSSTGASNPFVVTIDGNYKYVALIVTAKQNYCKFLSDISFGWEAEASQPAEKPSISYTEPVKAGDAITFSSTEGATISYEYGYGESADTPSYTFSGTGTSLTVPNDAAGKYFYVSAKAGGEGFTESEAATAIIQIAGLDKALAPTITAPDELKAGQHFTITTNSEGTTLHYQYAIADAETDTPQYGTMLQGTFPYYFMITDEMAGKVLYIRAYAGGTGFENSDYTENHFEIAANPTADAPTIEAPADANVRGGAEVTFTSQAGTSVEYYVAYSENEINEADAEYSYAWEQPFVLPYDKAGQYIYIKAVANGTGFNESAPAYWHALVLANPAAAAPKIEAPGELKIGQTFTFTTTQEGVTISYKYAVSETETAEPAYGEAVEGTEFTIPAEANGKWLYISATANGEKYTESPAATWGEQIMKTAEPVFFGYDVFTRTGDNGTTKVTADSKKTNQVVGNTSGLTYDTNNINNYDSNYITIGYYNQAGLIANTNNDKELFVDEVNFENYNTNLNGSIEVYASNNAITVYNYTSADHIATLSTSQLSTGKITGNYKFVAIVKPADSSYVWPLSPMTINIGWKKAVAEPETSLEITPVYTGDSQIELSTTEAGEPDANGWITYTWSVTGPSCQDTYDVDLTFKGYEYVAYATPVETGSDEPLNAPARRAAAEGFTTAFADLGAALTGYTDLKEVKLDENGEGTIQLPVANYGGETNTNVPATNYIVLPGYAAAEGETGVYNPDKKAVISSTVYYDSETSVIGIEAEEGEAEYYTLQGVRVANPEKGIYVRVANGKAAKVVL